MEYDDWKAREPDRDASEDVRCRDCGEDQADCVCNKPAFDDLDPEAITDEQVSEVCAELREKRTIIRNVEQILAGMESGLREQGASRWLDGELVVATFRAALGTAT